MSTAKIAFPPPPPTTNALTSQQRTQLLRTTKKLGRVLGATPHLMDTTALAAMGPLHIHLPFSENERHSHRESRGRNSSDSGSSDSTSTSRSSSAASIDRTSTLSTGTKFSRSTTTRSTSPPEFFNKADSWPSRLPLLRLAFTSPPSTLETIPASPPPVPTRPSHRRSRSINSVNGSGDTRYTLRPNPNPSPRDSLVDPDFTIPSANSIRRQKMDRLRRKLGDGVPLDLVFPLGDDEEGGEKKVDMKEEKELPSTPHVLRKAGSVRISYTRDSMSMASPSPHRARRRKPPVIVTLKASRPAPPPPSPQERKEKRKEKLSAIIESPEEHGIACSEEFGVGRVGSGRSSSGSSDSVASEWYFSDGEASETNVWNTRRGYKGWEEHEKRYESRRRSGGASGSA